MRREATVLAQASRATSAGRAGESVWFLGALAILLLGMSLRIWLYRQPVNSDDAQYFWIACVPEEITAIGGIDHTGLRASLLLFVRCISAPWGYSITGFYAAVYTAAVLCGVSVLVFARVVAGRAVALVTLLLWATSFVFLEVDTRLVPDNIGLMFALFALALVFAAARLDDIGSPAQRAGPGWWVGMFVCGLLLELSFSARATFAAFTVAAVVLLLWSRRRYRLLHWVVLGFAFGHALELVFIGQMVGDPLMRWKILFGYGDQVAEAKIFQGYTWSDLVLRYPGLLRASPAELALYGLGLLGAVVWLVRGGRTKRACFLLLVIAYSALAFSVTRLDPPVPLLREKLRYYATCAPLFYLAVAWLAVGIWPHHRWGGRIVALICVAGVAALGYSNVRAVAADGAVVANGNDHLFRAARAIKEDVRTNGHPRLIINDFRTQRVLRMLLTERDGWRCIPLWDAGCTSASTTPTIARAAYRLLSWRRLNANAQRHFLHGPLTHENYRNLETHRLLLRHRHGAFLTDVFHYPGKPLTRTMVEVTATLPDIWWCDSTIRRLADAPTVDLTDRLPQTWSDWDLDRRVQSPTATPSALRPVTPPAGWSRWR